MSKKKLQLFYYGSLTVFFCVVMYLINHPAIIGDAVAKKMLSDMHHAQKTAQQPPPVPDEREVRRRAEFERMHPYVPSEKK